MNKKNILLSLTTSILILTNIPLFSFNKKQVKPLISKNPFSQILQLFSKNLFLEKEITEVCYLKKIIRRKWREVNQLIDQFKSKKKSTILPKIIQILENECLAYQMILPKIRYKASVYLVTYYIIDKNYKKAFHVLQAILQAKRKYITYYLKGQAYALLATIYGKLASKEKNKKKKDALERKSAIAHINARRSFKKSLAKETAKHKHEEEEVQIYMEEEVTFHTLEAADYCLFYSYKNRKITPKTKIERYICLAEKYYTEIIDYISNKTKKNMLKKLSPKLLYRKAIALTHLGNTYRHPNCKKFDKTKNLALYKKTIELIQKNRKKLETKYSHKILEDLIKAVKDNIEETKMINNNSNNNLEIEIIRLKNKN